VRLKQGYSDPRAAKVAPITKGRRRHIMERRVINPWPWSIKLGFQQAIETTNATRTLYCSGQTAANEKGELQASGDMERQLLLSWENLETVLKESGYDAKDVTRLIVYVTNVDQFMGASASLGERMAAAGVQTAMTLIGVDRLAFEGQVCEIEATAAR
jgi:enamine deaminase RidA (YjgF/YER057c/UK114 family)